MSLEGGVLTQGSLIDLVGFVLIMMDWLIIVTDMCKFSDLFAVLW